jgi:hypothetical protein
VVHSPQVVKLWRSVAASPSSALSATLGRRNAKVAPGAFQQNIKSNQTAIPVRLRNLS